MKVSKITQRKFVRRDIKPSNPVPERDTAMSVHQAEHARRCVCNPRRMGRHR